MDRSRSAATRRGWLDKRKALGVRDIEAEDSHLRLHIFPSIGDMPLADVRPRHFVTMVESLRMSGIAPRSVRNVYSTAGSLLRDAAIADLVSASPCILTKRD